MKIYENIIIGNFLFALGYAISSKNGNAPFTTKISLIQQTPADRLLGDLMASLNNHIYLIEFKEASNRSNKERQKCLNLKRILNQPGCKDLLAISRKMHWYIETSVTKKSFNQQTLISHIGPYLDMELKTQRQPDVFAQFIEHIANEVSQPTTEKNIADCELYLQFVRKTLGGNSAFGTGGLLLAVNSVGEISYLPMEDLMELRMTYGKWRDLLERSWEQKQEHTKQLDLELDRELQRERGGRSYGR